MWNQPLCWLDDRTLAVYGYGDGHVVLPSDVNLIPAVRIFDVVSGKEIRWFAGPHGRLFFDRYLFSC